MSTNAICHTIRCRCGNPIGKKPQIYQVKEIPINEHNFDAFFVFSKDESVSSYH